MTRTCETLHGEVFRELLVINRTVWGKYRLFLDLRIQNWNWGAGEVGEEGRESDQSDAGIHAGVGDIDQEIEGDDHGGVDHDGAEDEGDIVVEAGVDEVLSEAGDGEEFFDDKGAGEDGSGGGDRKSVV